MIKVSVQKIRAAQAGRPEAGGALDPMALLINRQHNFADMVARLHPRVR
jgi:hypothetical protein